MHAQSTVRAVAIFMSNKKNNEKRKTLLGIVMWCSTT